MMLSHASTTCTLVREPLASLFSSSVSAVHPLDECVALFSFSFSALGGLDAATTPTPFRGLTLA